jgi:hypothetical protein
MHNTVSVITEKVMGTIKGMVYLAMRVSYRGGATIPEISSFLNDWAPGGSEMYHDGVVERVLQDLHRDGKVDHAGARWYPVGVAH